MNNKLMYGETAERGWNGSGSLALKPEDIKNPNANTTKDVAQEPRVSIPSPFARFELVQKAFYNLATLDFRSVDRRDFVLVSHALDLMQLFYEAPDELNYETWSKDEALDRLRDSGRSGNMLFAKALDKYARNEDYGFRGETQITIIKHGPDVVGCTSPTSMFLATPNYHSDAIRSILIDGGKPLFDAENLRQLFVRDEDFIEYVYRMAVYMGQGCDTLKEFRDYLETQKAKIREINSALFNKIAAFPYLDDNDTALSNYAQCTERGKEVYLCGKRLFQRRKEDARLQIEDNSGFVLQNAKNGAKPLVLTNNCTLLNVPYTTKTTTWSGRQHAINYTEAKTDTLPHTNIAYDWICEKDIFSDVLIMLPYLADNAHFFYGNTALRGQMTFLPPIREKFFEYFTVDYLLAENAGRKNLEIMPYYAHNGSLERVVVQLVLPIKNGQVQVLKKTYVPSETPLSAFAEANGLDSPDEAKGLIAEIPMSLSIFPFARLADNNHYRVMLATGMSLNMGSYKMILEPCVTGEHNADSVVDAEAFDRTDKTSYFSIHDLFDYFRLKVTDGNRIHEAICVPVWPEIYRGNGSLDFAFDFGTTNSHIAVQEDGMPRDFVLSETIVSMLPQNLETDDIDQTLMQTWMRQEFLPDQIGGKDSLYGFPLRTVMLQPKTLDLSSEAVVASPLMNLNIPFSYGKEDYNAANNKAIANLKWSTKTDHKEKAKLAAAFIDELAFLSRAYAIEKGAKLEKTRFAWTYPMSMKTIDYNMIVEEWGDAYKKYFDANAVVDDDDAQNIKSVSESIAPLLYYLNEDKVKSDDMDVSVDIGGGTCDVVIKRSKDNVKLTSFRFAGDVIFNAGRACDNKMVQKHYRKFLNLVSEMEKKGIGCGVTSKLLTTTCTGNDPATEANSLLFSLESLPALKNLDCSYNAQLARDESNKIVFIYFYGAIIFYLSRLLKQKGYDLTPHNLMFSGTGSKMLNIIGKKADLTALTKQMFLAFAGMDCSDLRVVVEADQPKQLTAKGALAQLKSNDDDNRSKSADIAKSFGIPRDSRANTIYSSLICEEELTYNDLTDDVFKKIQALVEEYNAAFLTLAAKMNFEEEFACDRESIAALKNSMNIRIQSILCSEKDELDPQMVGPIHDCLFFSPIREIIKSYLTE